MSLPPTKTMKVEVFIDDKHGVFSWVRTGICKDYDQDKIRKKWKGYEVRFSPMGKEKANASVKVQG